MEIKATTQSLPISLKKGDVDTMDQEGFAALISALLSSHHLPMQQQNLLQELSVMESLTTTEGQSSDHGVSLMIQAVQSQRDVIQQPAPEQNQDELSKLVEIFNDLIKKDTQLANPIHQHHDIPEEVENTQTALKDVFISTEAAIDNMEVDNMEIGNLESKTQGQLQSTEEAQIQHHKMAGPEAEVEIAAKTRTEGQHQDLTKKNTQEKQQVIAKVQEPQQRTPKAQESQQAAVHIQEQQPEAEYKIQVNLENQRVFHGPKDDVTQQVQVHSHDISKPQTIDEVIHNSPKKQSEHQRSDQGAVEHLPKEQHTKDYPLGQNQDEKPGLNYAMENSSKGLELDGQTEDSSVINFQPSTQRTNDQVSIPKEETSLGTAVVFKDQDMAHIVTERFKALRLPEVTEIKVKLNPEELGDILIKVTLEKGEIKGSIFADKKETYLIIQKQIDTIKQELQNNNLNLSSLNVFVNSDGGNGQNPSRQFNNQNKKPNQPFVELVEEAIDKKEEGLSIIA